MLKMINFSVLKIGFHGDTFFAWQHITNGIFHFTECFFLHTECGHSNRDSSKCNSNKTHITKAARKVSISHFSLGNSPAISKKKS